MVELSLIHLVATAGFCSLLWMVQLIVYPQMSRVREEDFCGHHLRHTRAIIWLVAPLFLVEGASAVVSFWLGWQAQPWGQAASLILFIANTAITFFWFVPAHHRLAGGKDDDLLRRMITTNWWRTVLSSFRLIVVVSLVNAGIGA